MMRGCSVCARLATVAVLLVYLSFVSSTGIYRMVVLVTLRWREGRVRRGSGVSTDRTGIICTGCNLDLRVL